MPSRQLPQPPAAAPIPQHLHRQNHITAVGSLVSGFSILLLFTFCFRKLGRKRTVPSDSKPPHRFCYSVLRRATSSFSPSHRLGGGGFGSVYRGTLKNPCQNVAVKVMDAGSLQGEREFQTELYFAGKIDYDCIVPVVGFSSDRKRRRMLLVYELMTNGSLQECLLYRKCSELKNWGKRFTIVLDIAKGLEYLHHCCDPPVIHGDIKPSNILLDENFRAKIGDFGLARLKSDEQCELTVTDNGIVEGRKDSEQNNAAAVTEDNASVVEETESVTTAGFDDFIGQTQSPGILSETSPEISMGEIAYVRSSPNTAVPEHAEASPAAVSPSEILDKDSMLESYFDRSSTGSGAGVVDAAGVVKRSDQLIRKSRSGKDWWWKQDNSGEESGVVKDYVMEWIGNEIKKERPKSDWIGASTSSGPVGKPEKKSKKKRLDWWMAMDDDKILKKGKRRPAREWWKEEYCEELARKNKKKKKKQKQGTISDGYSGENWWPIDEDLYAAEKKKKKKSRSRGSRSSVDWWLDGLSGELWGARGNSHGSVSGDIPKSSGVSSTPSMRGTVCYTAPEYGGGGDLSEKCDVYSFGVLLLVLIAGRRPLQVTGSPLSEFQRANLISWSRHMARVGKLLDIVDKGIEFLDQEQALLCITIALLCIQKSPSHRPSMKEVVRMLSGEMNSPQLPVEFSPSPPSRFPYKSKKGPTRGWTFGMDAAAT